MRNLLNTTRRKAFAAGGIIAALISGGVVFALVLATITGQGSGTRLSTDAAVTDATAHAAGTGDSHLTPWITAAANGGTQETLDGVISSLAQDEADPLVWSVAISGAIPGAVVPVDLQFSGSDEVAYEFDSIAVQAADGATVNVYAVDNGSRTNPITGHPMGPAACSTTIVGTSPVNVGTVLIEIVDITSPSFTFEVVHNLANDDDDASAEPGCPTINPVNL